MATPGATGGGLDRVRDLRAWVLDVGNTRTALGAVATDGTLISTWRAPTPRTPTSPCRLPDWPPAPAHVASVVAAAATCWSTALAALGCPVTIWGDDRPIPIAHPYPPPSRPGADRLIAARETWMRLRRSAVIVDAGSAVTVDVVSDGGEFLGGAIAPGIRALVAGMAAIAPELPPADPAQVRPYPAGATQDAVNLGVDATACGMAVRLVGEARAWIGSEAPVVVTGGDAGRFAAYLAACQPAIVQELVLEGLARLSLET